VPVKLLKDLDLYRKRRIYPHKRPSVRERFWNDAKTHSSRSGGEVPQVRISGALPANGIFAPLRQ
jgi:hypothetical protein